MTAKKALGIIVLTPRVFCLSASRAEGGAAPNLEESHVKSNLVITTLFPDRFS